GTKAHTQVAYASSYEYQLGAGQTLNWPAGNGNWYPFGGLLDEPALYTRALSASEVRALVNAGSAGKFSPVAVANIGPTVTSFTVPVTGAEGSPVNLSATATDPGGAADPLTYTWTVTGPNGSTVATLTGASATYIPPDNGDYGVRLTVTDGDGGTAQSTPAGLLSWLPGDGNANDVRGVQNGTLVNGTGFAPGKFGRACRLDGMDDFVGLPANSLPYPTAGTSTAPLSFETWFQTTTGGVILGQQGPGGYVPAVYVGTDGRLRAQMFWKGAVDPIVSAVAVNDGQFHHVAVAYDGSAQTVYLDGVAIGTKAHTQVAYAPSYEYQLGAGQTFNWPAGNGNWYPFGGLLDEPALYTRPLSASEVRALV